MKLLSLLVVALLLVTIVSGIGIAGERGDKIKIVSTLQIFSTIAKRIGGDYVDSSYIVPPGTDIHDYSLTPQDVNKIENSDLVVLANSQFFAIDREIKSNAEGKEVLDFPDYNATLLPVGDLQKCYHGYWLYSQNTQGIARAIYLKLSAMDPAKEAYFKSRYLSFLTEVNATMNTSKNMMGESSMSGQGALLAVPGVFYIVKELGMRIDGLLVEGPNQFASQAQIEEYKEEIRDGKIKVIVNVKNMEDSKAGIIAREISKETGAKVVYLDIFSSDNFSSLILGDAAILSSVNYVEEYSSVSCDYYPYIYTIVAMTAIIAIISYFAYSYRKELLK